MYAVCSKFLLEWRNNENKQENENLWNISLQSFLPIINNRCKSKSSYSTRENRNHENI